MKNKILWLALLLFPVVLGSCSKDEDIVFDHERQMFEIQDGKILLEVILPGGTTDGEEIYISGAFNGGDEVAVGKDEFKLIRTDLSTIKRAVYLDPSTFVDGKTLADGYHFVSKKSRQEVDLNGNDKWHYDNPGVNNWTNVTVARWAAYYDKPDEGGESDTDPDVEHDGYVVYVDDQTGWGALALYAWGDAEAFGGWPGMQVTGTRKINGVVYKYFDMGEAHTGLTEHLIFNNNDGGSQLPDFDYTIDHNLYLRITATGVEELEEPTPAEPEIVHTDGYILFVKNESSQTNLALYAWGDAEAFGVWPGKLPDGTMTIGGVEYVYFNIGEANTGLTLNFIPNNNNDGVQWEGGSLGITVDHDIFVRIWDGDASSYEILEQ